MIRADSISLAFKKQTIFNKISFMVQSYEKIALVGSNGAGKSTMLKIIAGDLKADKGKITQTNGFRVAYLPQEVVLKSEKTIFDETFTAFGELSEWHEEELALEKSGNTGTERYVELHTLLAENEYGLKCSQASQVLGGLGFSTKDMKTQLVSELSVGWQMRVVLAKLLLQEADFYLFDEPTNHLDLPAKEWFCSFLQKKEQGYLLISHDRYFLDNACDQVYELDQGTLTEYSGNYTDYVKEKASRIEAIEAARVVQQKEIARKKQLIEKFRSKASKAKMAQSMIRELEKMDVIQAPRRRKKVSVPLQVPERAGKEVLEVKKVAKSFGEKHLFSDVSFRIERGAKVALVAPNGKGKTTLLNCIMGKLKQDSGEIAFGHNVTPAVFEQEQVSVLNPRKTVYEEVDTAASPEMREKVRMLLGCFLFSGDSVHKKTSVLSGGERNRVAMAKVLCQNANILLLDEPTNHLDLESKEVLLSALKSYQGTIIFVSHDRDFIDNLATEILSLDKSVVNHFKGDYESFCYQYPDHHKSDAIEDGGGSKDKAGAQAYAQQKQMARLEKRIEKLEDEKAKCGELMGEYEYGSAEYDKVMERYDKACAEVDPLQKEWDQLSQSLED